MAPLTLVFERTQAKLDTLTLDVSLQEQHAVEADITEHPVEEGANIVDHIRQKPQMLTIEGLITNTPIPDPSAAVAPHTQNNVNFISRSTGDSSRSGQAYQQLMTLFQAGKLLTVVTALKTYQNMALKSVSIPRDATTGHVLRFTATLMEVKQVASAQTVTIPKAAPKKPTGEKAKTDTQEPHKTILKAGADFVRGR